MRLSEMCINEVIKQNQEFEDLTEVQQAKVIGRMDGKYEDFVRKYAEQSEDFVSKLIFVNILRLNSSDLLADKKFRAELTHHKNQFM